MFKCPFEQCVRTFTRRAALREHLKTHEREIYWAKLDNTNVNTVNEKIKISVMMMKLLLAMVMKLLLAMVMMMRSMLMKK